MKKLKLLLLFISLFALNSKPIFAQSSETVRKYIETFKRIAIEEEIRTGVPAAITLAQGIHETGAGTSDLVLSSNNHFGIKCKADWKGESVRHDDDAKGECFRKYENPFESYKDHSDFLKNRPYYTSLFNLDPTDYKAWATGLKKAGYATNPKYAQILIKLIEDYNLQDYTLIALGRKLPDEKDAIFVSNEKEVSTGISTENPGPVNLVIKTAPQYPEGIFRINDTKVIFVTKGTAFIKIADDHDISLSRLYEFNDMDPADIAEEDGLIYLQRKRKSGANEFHIVNAGETLFDIAQIEAIRMESLLEYNFLRQNLQPAAGEKLYLQKKAPAMPRLAETKQTASASTVTETEINTDALDNSVVFHTVQPKETVYAISKKYSVGIEELLKWNDLQSTDLKTGQQLRINKKSTNATN